MSVRKVGVGLSAVVGVVFLSVGIAAADENQPSQAPPAAQAGQSQVASSQQGHPDDAQDTPKTGVKRLRAGRSAGVRARTEEDRTGKGERSGDQQTRRSRVRVRDLRARQGTDQPFFSFPPGYPLYWPYAHYYAYDPSRIHQSLIDVYRAQRYIERKERERRRNRREMAQRELRLLDRHERALAAGLEQLKGGDAARATVALTLAAKLNQGDPACRIHLAQARLAQGHYREAALALRRALELQPKLVYTDLHLQRYHHSEGALGRYTDALRRWLDENPARPEVYFLLGFFEFQQGEFAAAHRAFERVQSAIPDDELTCDYIEITKPIRP